MTKKLKNKCINKKFSFKVGQVTLRIIRGLFYLNIFSKFKRNFGAKHIRKIIYMFHYALKLLDQLVKIVCLTCLCLSNFIESFLKLINETVFE